MNKKLAILGMMCFVILIFTSCGISDRFSEKYDSEKKNVVKAVTEEIDGAVYTTKLVYNDVEYIWEEKELFFVTTPDLSSVPDENDIALSWSGFRFGFSTVYYSETSEDPLFIYTPVSFHDLYLRSDYNYMMDTFNVEGTGMEISLSSIINFDSEIVSLPVSHEPAINVRLISKTNPRIKCDLEVFEYNDSWYSIAGQFYISELSPQMVQELKDNNVI